MQVVIDIPDRYTKLIGFTTPELEVIAKAVIHGTPLPDDAEILTAEAYSELCLMASALRDIKSEIKALEQQPCEDCISRQAVLEVLATEWNMHTSADDAMQESIYDIKTLPSVTPQPKVGKWLEKEINSDTAIMVWQSAKCSVCDRYHTTPYMYYFSHYDYCPHCGAKMEVET